MDKGEYEEGNERKEIDRKGTLGRPRIKEEGREQRGR